VSAFSEYAALPITHYDEIESERIARTRANKRKAGLASFAAHGEAMVARLRAIASEGGRARQRMPDAKETLRRVAVEGGRASWRYLTPEERAHRQRRAVEVARGTRSHEQFVENGKRAAAIRWGRVRAQES
jgi:hypothetical protein